MAKTATRRGGGAPLTLILFLLAVFSFLPFAQAGDVRVKGYFRKDGTYVAPHYRSAPNSTKLDNWSTKGNINPYTGKPGTKNAEEPGNYLQGTPLYGTPSSPSSNTSAPRYSAPTNVEKDTQEIPPSRPDGSLFSRARQDCSWARGSSFEDNCIRDRMQAIENVNTLKSHQLFQEAYQDCSWARGSSFEDNCIRDRIGAIESVATLKSHRLFGEAFQDCSWARGSSFEDNCIRDRILAIENIEAMMPGER